jgi:hypothetical protein
MQVRLCPAVFSLCTCPSCCCTGRRMGTLTPERALLHVSLTARLLLLPPPPSGQLYTCRLGCLGQEGNSWRRLRVRTASTSRSRSRSRSRSQPHQRRTSRRICGQRAWRGGSTAPSRIPVPAQLRCPGPTAGCACGWEARSVRG